MEESKTKTLTAENEDVKITIELKTPKAGESFRFKRDASPEESSTVSLVEVTFDELPQQINVEVEDVISQGEGFIIIK